MIAKKPKCRNGACGSSEECALFRSKPAQFHQRYAEFKPASGEIACDYFERWEEKKNDPK